MGNQPMAEGMASVVQDNSPRTLKKFFSELPGDENNRLRAALDVVTTPRPGELNSSQMANALQAFKAINSSQTGRIDIGEFKYAMEAFGIKMLDADTEAVFKSFDIDNDSRLNFEEFVSFIQFALQYRPTQSMMIDADDPILREVMRDSYYEQVKDLVAPIEPPPPPPPPEPELPAAVRGGQAMPDIDMDQECEHGLCCWQGPDSVHCPQTKTNPSGDEYGVRFHIKMAHRDFAVELKFKMHFRHGTGASLAFISGKNEQHVGLDGAGQTLFLEGGSFGHAGPSNMFGEAPSAHEMHTLVVTRINDMMTVTLDGQRPYPEKPMPATISDVVVRPWKNKLEIFEFRLVNPHLS
jgi:hypothetical protein